LKRFTGNDAVCTASSRRMYVAHGSAKVMPWDVKANYTKYSMCYLYPGAFLLS
jgi:hypothetical protein